MSGEKGINDEGSKKEIRDPLTSDYVTGVKERAALKQQIEELSKQLNHAKGQNYDLMKEIEAIKKQNGEVTKKTKGKMKAFKKKPAKRQKPRAKLKNGETVNKHETSSSDFQSEHFEDQETLYAEIAKRYPELPLSSILTVQHHFTEADVNNDGTIDAEELEKMMDSLSLLFTKDEIGEIVKTIDVDGSNSLDFFECLEVCDLLRKNKRSGLPQSIQNQKSALCTIQ